MKRVLVTRPEPGASATANRLRAMGFESVVLPLSRIVALPVVDDLPDCEAIAVTSVNALRHAPREFIEKLSGKPCFAVGERTGDAARVAGFANVVQTAGDAESLAKVIIAANVKGVIAYLAGRVRLLDFETALEKAGVRVIPIEVYDTEPVEPTAPEIEALRTGRPIDAVLVYSAKAAEALRKLAERPEMAETFSKTVHCCLSERIAARFEGVEPAKIRIADHPDEDALFALLNL
ncbi:MAG: uroporphyrinogen-III synthase [Mesorhizobium sp.]